MINYNRKKYSWSDYYSFGFCINENGKSVNCTGATFVHCRKKRNIMIKQNVKGTVSLPFDSTKNIKESFNIEEITKKMFGLLGRHPRLLTELLRRNFNTDIKKCYETRLGFN